MYIVENVAKAQSPINGFPDNIPYFLDKCHLLQLSLPFNPYSTGQVVLCAGPYHCSLLCASYYVPLECQMLNPVQ